MLPVEGAVATTPAKRVRLGMSLTVKREKPRSDPPFRMITALDAPKRRGTWRDVYQKPGLRVHDGKKNAPFV